MATSKPRPKKRAKKLPPSRLAESKALAALRTEVAGRALEDSEARFRDFAQASSDWLWETDAENRYSWFSGNLEEGVGRPPGFYLGRDRFEVAVASGADLDAEPWKSHVAAIKGREPFRGFRHRRVTPHGEFWLSISGVPRFDPGGGFLGYRAAVSNITAQVQAEQRARDAIERLGAALDGLNESIAVTDAEDRIVVTNRYFRALNGNTHLVDPGRHYAEHLRAGIAIGNYPEAVGRAEAWLAARLAARRRGGTVEVQRQDGMWLQVTDQRLPDGGTITFALDISGRKRAEQVLAEREARFRDFAEAAGEWFWETDAAFRYTWISDSIVDLGGDQASSLLGESRIDLAAKRGVDIAAEPWRSHIETLGRHEPFRGFRYIREVDGKPLWISSSGLPVFGADGAFRGYRGVGIDITREVELERQAHEADQRLRAAIEGLGESISLTDADDRIILTNRAFRELNQYTGFLERQPRYEEHLRAALSGGRVPEAAGREEEWLRERMARHNAGGSAEVRRLNDRWMLVTEHRLPDGGTITFSMDISAQKQVEIALRDLNASLEQRVAERTAELKTAYQELESFSYSVSHDLRAPLRAISGFAGILREEESSRLSESGLRHLGTIDASAQQMGKLVDALLDLVRMSRHAISGARLDMAQIARDVAQQLLAEHPRARVEVGEMPPATGDATLVRQVYANLVGNALKYSSQQGAPRVDIGAERGPAGTVYFVRDNGVGFDMRYSGKLFKPFERLHTDPGFEGTGIGLALASLIVHRHGGRIEADSAPGEGATFRFTLGGA